LYICGVHKGVGPKTTWCVRETAGVCRELRCGVLLPPTPAPDRTLTGQRVLSSLLLPRTGAAEGRGVAREHAGRGDVGDVMLPQQLGPKQCESPGRMDLGSQDALPSPEAWAETTRRATGSKGTCPPSPFLLSSSLRLLRASQVPGD
jgi:hypothetical protein